MGLWTRGIMGVDVVDKRSRRGVGYLRSSESLRGCTIRCVTLRDSTIRGMILGGRTIRGMALRGITIKGMTLRGMILRGGTIDDRVPTSYLQPARFQLDGFISKRTGIRQ